MLTLINHAFKIGEEYTYQQLEQYIDNEDYSHQEFGYDNVIGESAIVITDTYNKKNWFILASATGSAYYYKYVFRG